MDFSDIAFLLKILFLWLSHEKNRGDFFTIDRFFLGCADTYVFWLRYEAYFPVYPEWFIHLLLRICHITQKYCGQETLYDLYFLSGSIINVSVLALSIYLIYRFLKSKQKADSST
ncbi:hypothetical protein [Oligella urethralis]|uniref:hypothetical protein n=1 Tax=Oligella urethralis TaxID=90245 RepID=UPI00128DD68E|nr:hypothetical protein [Oligella urethralis]